MAGGGTIFEVCEENVNKSHRKLLLLKHTQQYMYAPLHTNASAQRDLTQSKVCCEK
jgi:hypothetical protein